MSDGNYGLGLIEGYLSTGDKRALTLSDVLFETTRTMGLQDMQRVLRVSPSYEITVGSFEVRITSLNNSEIYRRALCQRESAST